MTPEDLRAYCESAKDDPGDLYHTLQDGEGDVKNKKLIVAFVTISLTFVLCFTYGLINGLITFNNSEIDWTATAAMMGAFTGIAALILNSISAYILHSEQQTQTNQMEILKIQSGLAKEAREAFVNCHKAIINYKPNSNIYYITIKDPSRDQEKLRLVRNLNTAVDQFEMLKNLFYECEFFLEFEDGRKIFSQIHQIDDYLLSQKTYFQNSIESNSIEIIQQFQDESEEIVNKILHLGNMFTNIIGKEKNLFYKELSSYRSLLKKNNN